jgi:hypothetical protein
MVLVSSIVEPNRTELNQKNVDQSVYNKKQCTYTTTTEN